MHQGMGPGLRFEEKPTAETHLAAGPALPKYQHSRNSILIWFPTVSINTLD
jgi:hypothetical protein